MIKVGVYGATGYTGAELIGILLGHPKVEITFMTSETYKGQKLSDVFPGAIERVLCSKDEADPAGTDAVFTCLPHTTAMELIAGIYRPGLKIIDLSADFRFFSAEDYKSWYGLDHLAPELLEKSAYGMPEFFRDEIKVCEIAGNPGCYPTSALLALGPLAREGLLKNGEIIVDAKSGVSGAGRKPDLSTHYVEVNENIVPYKLGRSHRHVGEMEVILSQLAGEPVQVVFTPQLAPFSRGILSTIYVNTDTGTEKISKLYKDFYAGEPFVKILDKGKPAQLAYVQYNNDCVIGVHRIEGSSLVLITSAIDNLVKGAAGQAVQNFNIMFGLDERSGLNAPGGRI